MYSIEVPTLEAFNELAARVDRVEAENDFLKSLLLGERWLNREKTMKALGCKDSKLRQLTLLNKIAHHYEGTKPYYDVFSIRTYLTGQKIDALEIDKRLLSAHFVG